MMLCRSAARGEGSVKTGRRREAAAQDIIMKSLLGGSKGEESQPLTKGDSIQPIYVAPRGTAGGTSSPEVRQSPADIHFACSN